MVGKQNSQLKSKQFAVSFKNIKLSIDKSYFIGYNLNIWSLPSFLVPILGFLTRKQTTKKSLSENKSNLLFKLQDNGRLNILITSPAED